MPKEEINFLKKTSSLKGPFATIEYTLERVTWWVLGGVLVLSAIVGSTYLYGMTRVKKLEAKHTALLLAIVEQKTKEGILVSLKQRSAIAAKALQAAREYGKLFPLLETIAPQTYYTSLSIDDVGRSTVTLELPSVDDAVTIVKNVLTQVEQKQLRNPEMMSFFLKDSGIVQLSLSFIATL